MKFKRLYASSREDNSKQQTHSAGGVSARINENPCIEAMEIINLTPHPINLVTPSGVTTVPQSGTVARVSVKNSDAGTFDGVPLVTSVYGDPVDLPASRDGVLYVVSALVRTSCPDRKDLASPSGLVRDSDGNIIGCKALEINA